MTVLVEIFGFSYVCVFVTVVFRSKTSVGSRRLNPSLTPWFSVFSSLHLSPLVVKTKTKKGVLQIFNFGSLFSGLSFITGLRNHETDQTLLGSISNSYFSSSPELTLFSLRLQIRVLRPRWKRDPVKNPRFDTYFLKIFGRTLSLTFLFHLRRHVTIPLSSISSSELFLLS